MPQDFLYFNCRLHFPLMILLGTFRLILISTERRIKYVQAIICIPVALFHTFMFDKDISLFVHIYITGSFACIWFFFLLNNSFILFYFILSWLAVGCSITIFFLIGEPYERGFFCNDEDLMHPYHKSTVKHWMLFVFGIIIPVVIVSINFFLWTLAHVT